LIIKGGTDSSVNSFKSGIVFDPGSSFLYSSYSVHYPHLTHINLSSGASCHAHAERNDAHHWKLPLPVYVSTGIPLWVHVFSKTMPLLSLRTQCTSIAHSDGLISNTVHHRCNHRARKNIKKQQQTLQEIVVPISQVKLSTNKIDKNIIVFDGGNIHTPPLRPKDGKKWCSIKVHDLYINNEVNGDMGLTFPHIDGALPFICLP
jgi:hypothetical protein